MPELPEVETIKLQLNKFLVGHKIVSIDVRNRKIFQGDEKRIIGAKVTGTRRFGKVTVIDLDNKYSILTHVKLTGQFIYRGPNLDTNSLSTKVIGGLGGLHTLVIFTLDKKGLLYYNDVRRFGWIRLEKTSEVENESFIKKLGPDMLKVDFNNFNEIFSKTSPKISFVSSLSLVSLIYPLEKSLTTNSKIFLKGISPE